LLIKKHQIIGVHYFHELSAEVEVFLNKTLIQILKNIITSWCAVGLQAVIGLVMVPFLLGKLGKDGYGAVGILSAIISFAGIADLGLRQALNRELSETVAKKDIEGFRRLSSSAIVLYIGVAVMISGVGAIFAAPLCSLFKVNEHYFRLMVLLLRTYAPLSVLLSFVTPVFTAGICSFMRYDLENNVSITAQICISLMLLICLSVFDINPMIIWCAVMVVGGLFRMSMLGYLYRKVCYGGHIGIRYIQTGCLLPLFNLGGSMYVLQLTHMLAERMDPLIISRFISLEGVALYQAGSRLPQMVNLIVLAAVNQLTPLTTKYHVGDIREREQQVLILGTKYTLYLGAFFSAGIILFADSFCHLWLFDKLGDDVKMVALVMKMWAVANLFNYAGGAHWPILLGKRRLKFAVWLEVPTAVFNVVLSVYLVGFTSLGVVGVLVGTVISEVIRRPIAIWYVSRLLRLPFWRYIAQAYSFPVLYIFGMFLIGFWATSQFVTLNWSGLIVSIGAYCLPALVVLSLIEYKVVYKVCEYFGKSYDAKSDFN
jgi:O-antigen/teichoic acid export membrane protein